MAGVSGGPWTASFLNRKENEAGTTTDELNSVVMRTVERPEEGVHRFDRSTLLAGITELLNHTPYRAAEGDAIGGEPSVGDGKPLRRRSRGSLPKGGERPAAAPDHRVPEPRRSDGRPGNGERRAWWRPGRCSRTRANFVNVHHPDRRQSRPALLALARMP
jgi:hypothetical protein